MGVPPFELDCIRSLPRLRELERRYRAEEVELQQGLLEATDDLDRWLFVQRLLRPEGPTLAVRRLCETLQEGVEGMERDLVEIRSAIGSLADEIAVLEQRARADLTAAPRPTLRSSRLHVLAGAPGADDRDLHARFRADSHPWL